MSVLGQSTMNSQEHPMVMSAHATEKNIPNLITDWNRTTLASLEDLRPDLETPLIVVQH
jgi:hypothetical protein